MLVSYIKSYERQKAYLISCDLEDLTLHTTYCIVSCSRFLVTFVWEKDKLISRNSRKLTDTFQGILLSGKSHEFPGASYVMQLELNTAPR